MIYTEFLPKLALAAALAVLPAPAFADALQLQVLAGAKAASEEDFAYTQTTINQRSGEEAKEYVTRYDPTRPKGSRWTLVKAEGRAPTTKELAGFGKRANSGPAPSYAQIAKWFGAPATRIATGKDSVTYRFASLPKGTVKMPGGDLSANSSAEAVVDTSGPTPFVERVRLITNKPFRIMLIAKINRLEAVTTYRLMPDGRPAIVASVTDLTGSAMGKSGTFKTRTAFTDHRAAR